MGGDTSPLPLPLARRPPLASSVKNCRPADLHPCHHATSPERPAPLASPLARGVLGPPGRGPRLCFSDFCLKTWAQGLSCERLTFPPQTAPGILPR